MYKIAYVTGGFFFFVIWLVMYIGRRDLRREMVTMGLLSCLWLIVAGSVFHNIYLNEYWQPDYLGLLKIDRFFQKIGMNVSGTEDVFFWFFISGIGAVLYEELFHKRHTTKEHRKNRKYYLLLPAIIFFSFLLISILGNINIIYGEYLGYIISAGIIWIFRKDLFIHSITTAFSLSLLFFVFYVFYFFPLFPGIIHKWWILAKTSGIFISGIPLEELMWSFSFGLFIAPIYEFLHGIKDK